MLQLHPPIDRAVDHPVDAEALDALYAQPPGVRLGMVASVDGATTVAGSSRGLSGEADRLLIGLLRSHADVVLVGAGTVRAESYPPLRVRPERQQRRRARGQAPVPRLAVLSRGRGLDPGSPLLAPGSGLLLLVPHDAEVPDGVDAVRLGRLSAGPDLAAAAVAALRERSLPRVLCEGGPSLNGALLAAGLVDEVCATTSPQLVGGAAPRLVSGAPEGPVPLRLAHLLLGDGALLTRWVRQG